MTRNFNLQAILHSKLILYKCRLSKVYIIGSHWTDDENVESQASAVICITYADLNMFV